jgi:hypothetical protein
VTTSIRRSDLRSKHSLLSSIVVGRTFRVTVTASNSSGSATGTSAATAVVAATTSTSAPSLVWAPVISGTAQQGQTLSSSTGTWNGTQPISYSYQWYRRDSGGNNCAAGPTGQSYLLSSTDVGRTFRVTVTRVQLSGSATGTSAATAVVASPPPDAGWTNVISTDFTTNGVLPAPWKAYNFANSLASGGYYLASHVVVSGGIASLVQK